MNVVIIGASGYSGLELIRILLQHPKVKITHLFAHKKGYPSVTDLYPHLRTLIDMSIDTLDHLTDEKIESLKETTDIVFFATPSGVSKEWGPVFLKKGLKIIDLSGDFRIHHPKIYQEWYHLDAPDSALLQQATYGLSEWFPKEIEKATYIANPGCYATSILLALAPLYHHHVPVQSVIIDAKSGVSGAGKGFSQNTHFSEVNDNFKVYKVGQHQHIPEIEQVLSQLDGKPTIVQMMTHLIPMTRGILSSIYLDLERVMTHGEIDEIYQTVYKGQPFIRLRPQGDYPETKHVYGTNFCDIGFYIDQRTNRLIIFSVIDNLMKGAAGQAVQNLNIMMGWDQTLGLSFIPIYP